VPDTAVVTALRDFFEHGSHGCKFAYLFGSRARDDFRDHSDVDVAVMWETEPENAVEAMGLGISAELTRLLGREVDVVVLDNAPVDVSQRVIRDGQIVLDRDPVARIRWEVKTRTLFLELLPALREYRRMKA
jgi:predicted nucleotidyltransferase